MITLQPTALAGKRPGTRAAHNMCKKKRKTVSVITITSKPAVPSKRRVLLERSGKGQKAANYEEAEEM